MKTYYPTAMPQSESWRGINQRVLPFFFFKLTTFNFFYLVFIELYIFPQFPSLLISPLPSSPKPLALPVYSGDLVSVLPSNTGSSEGECP